MDQANTLRALLKQSTPSMTPILGDLSSPYFSLLCRGMLSELGNKRQRVVLFDAGVLSQLTGQARGDLADAMMGKRGLEDLAMALDEYRYLVPSMRGLAALAKQEIKTTALFKHLTRLPVTADCLLVSLPTGAWKLASDLGKGHAWTWVVEPSRQSVTQTFQSLRHLRGDNSGVNHRIIVAGAKSAGEADEVFSSLLEVCGQHLESPLQYGGHLPKLDSKQTAHLPNTARVAVSRVAKALCASNDLAFA